MDEPKTGQEPPNVIEAISHTGRKRKSKVEIDAVSDKIVRLRYSGLSFRDIAKETGIPRSTAQLYHKNFMLEFKKLHQDDQDVLLAEYHAQTERIKRVRWTAFSASHKKDAQGNIIPGTGNIRILRDLQNTLDSCFDRLQSAGLLPKVTEKTQNGGDDKIIAFFDKAFKKSGEPEKIQKQEQQAREKKAG